LQGALPAAGALVGVAGGHAGGGVEDDDDVLGFVIGALRLADADEHGGEGEEAEGERDPVSWDGHASLAGVLVLEDAEKHQAGDLTLLRALSMEEGCDEG